MKKSPDMKEWMDQADSPKETSNFKRMNGPPQLFRSFSGMKTSVLVGLITKGQIESVTVKTRLAVES